LWALKAAHVVDDTQAEEQQLQAESTHYGEFVVVVENKPAQAVEL
jgi:hypothetical protein